MKKVVNLLLMTIFMFSCSTSKVEKKDEKKTIEPPKISDFELLKGDLNINLIPQDTVFFGFIDTPQISKIKFLSTFKNTLFLKAPKLYLALTQITPKISGIIFTKDEIPQEYLKSERVRQVENLTIHIDKEYEWVKTVSGMIGGDAGFTERLISQQSIILDENQHKNSTTKLENSNSVDSQNSLSNRKNSFFSTQIDKHSNKLFLISAYFSKNEMDLLKKIGKEAPILNKLLLKAISATLYGEKIDDNIILTLELKSDKSAIKDIVTLLSMQYSFLMLQIKGIKKLISTQIPKEDIEHIVSIIKSFKISEVNGSLKISISLPEKFDIIEKLPAYMTILFSLNI
ncbi:hypothetical protein JXR93_02535 [bacterium]|nr:hypothetical protein [bacterium]